VWLFVRRSRSGRTDLGLQNFRPSPIEKLIPNQSVLGLTARTCASQNFMSLIPKDETDPESGFRILSKSFAFNNMAERVGFEFTRKRSFNNIERTAGTVKQ